MSGNGSFFKAGSSEFLDYEIAQLLRWLAPDVNVTNSGRKSWNFSIVKPHRQDVLTAFGKRASLSTLSFMAGPQLG
jgi:hypothetical protein